MSKNTDFSSEYSNPEIVRFVKETLDGTCTARVHSPRSCEVETRKKYLLALTTHLTIDRLPALEKILKRWKGHITAALLTTNIEQEKEAKLFASRWRKQLNMITWRKPCSYPFSYPVNFLRNLANEACNADVLINVGVDFIPSPDLYPALLKMAQTGKFEHADAYAVPAFLSLPGTLPKNKLELIEEVKKHRAKPILTAGEPADNDYVFLMAHEKFIDYKRWYKATEPYVRPFQMENEPYMVYNASHPCAPRYDERFTFYGGDKAEFVHHLDSLGWRMIVLPDQFLLHEKHSYAPWSNESERFLYRPVVLQWLEEIQKERLKETCPCADGKARWTKPLINADKQEWS